jgi:UDP-N-acetylglucosamine/UDP-N-acetylgalactosamine diphosphorylase
MHDVPQPLLKKLREADQDHVLAFWSQLTADERKELTSQLEALDLDLLAQLYEKRDHQEAVPADHRIAPIPTATLDARERSRGEESLRRGEVAALVVAGGQGTRLGFDHPKGMFAVGPVSGKSLFQIHAEKVLALARRYGRSIPFLLMTSPATHQETVDYFEQHRYFGLPEGDVFFFCQGTMPALDLKTGRLLLEAPGRLFLGPNGHGGTLLALSESGLLASLRERGIRTIYYFQVDNPLAKIADPAFLGAHLGARAQVSTKAITKEGPLDKLGNLVLIDGRCGMIEYSDLPERLAHQQEDNGRLRLRIGNPAIHLFDLEFLESVTAAETRIPFHVARKKVPYLDQRGQLVQPATENALKFEMFIFDVLPRADRWTVVETQRSSEFYPLKNATGEHAPESVRQAISEVAAAWLEEAGAVVARDERGKVAVPLEISPLAALEAADLRGRFQAGTRIEKPAYFG